MLDKIKYENEIKKLISISKELNCVTLDQINTIFKNPSTSLIEEVVDYLDTLGIECGWFENEPTLEDLEMMNNNLYSYDTKTTVTNDSVKTYLNEINRIPLLTAAEELKYANDIRYGLEAENKLCNKLGMSVEEIKNLRNLSSIGISARQVLIESNLRLVVSIAKHYAYKGIPFLDLVQEGNIGLIKAVYKFDPTKGFRFSTYATWWIRQAIMRSICENSRLIRLPVHIFELLNKMYKLENALYTELKRMPSVEELAKALEITVEKVVMLKSLTYEISSLDAQIASDQDVALADILVDKEVLSPLDYVEKKLYQEQIDKLLQTLPSREEYILRLRYGLEDKISRTLEEIGSEVGLTRERVRQIEMKAISRLKHPSRIKIIKEIG